MSMLKKLLFLLVITTMTLVATSLVFAQASDNKQEQTPKTDPPVVAAKDVVEAKNVVEATVTGRNYCLGCALKEKGAGSQCSSYGPMHALRVSKVVVDGKEQADMQGWVLHYLPTQSSQDLLNKHTDETVTVTGKIYTDERVLEVSSFTVANAPAAATTAPEATTTAPVVVATAPVTVTKEITWKRSLPEALAEAKERNTLIVVDFYAEWCHWCKTLDAETFTNPGVQTRLRDFTLLRIDTDKQPDLAKRYGVTGLPTTVVLNTQGAVLVRQDGFLAPDAYLKLLARAKSN